MLGAMRQSSLALVCCALGLNACAHRPPPPISEAPRAVEAKPTPAPDALARSYVELVRQAAARDGKTEETVDCLLSTTDQGSRFRGEVAVGIRPLPLPAVDLDASLAESISVNLLSAYGRHGDAPAALTFSAFSYAPPTREAVLLALTDRGSYVRSTQARGPREDRTSSEQAVRSATGVPGATVFVAAEADTPVTQLHELLGLLAAVRAPVVLAVNLAPDTRLPAPEQLPDVLCADGLPETSAPAGDLDGAVIRPALAPLIERAADCLPRADAQGAAGGRMELAIRVAASGAVETACIVSDQTADAKLRACVVEEAKKLAFPGPKPAGSVDLQLPIVLTARHHPAPQAICEASYAQ